MILVDYREKAPGRHDQEAVKNLIARIGVRAQTEDLPYADFAFEGKDPSGNGGCISVGVERKRLHDMLACIDDSRYSASQRIGMKRLYAVSFLIIEGLWKPHDPKGTLMEGFPGDHWREMNGYYQRALYSKLRRYLLSVSLTGVHVIYSRDIFQSAFDICEMYHYFQKREHTSMMEKQKLNIPSLQGKPPLVQRWAMELDGIGVKMSEDATRLFKTPIALANSEVLEWLSIPHVGLKTAESIVAEIEGKK